MYNVRPYHLFRILVSIGPLSGLMYCYGYEIVTFVRDFAGVEFQRGYFVLLVFLLLVLSFKLPITRLEKEMQLD